MIKSGNLRLDQKYSYVAVDHLIDSYSNCEYCGKVIRNLFTIEGELDKKQYIVGSECVVNLTILNPTMELELKRKLRRKLKFIKTLKSCQYLEYWNYKDTVQCAAWETKEQAKNHWGSWRTRSRYDDTVKKIFKGESVFKQDV